MSELEVYSNGIVHCSICTNIEGKAMIENMVNAKNPTGLRHGWKISEDKTFANGQPNPCPCGQREGYKHYLMVC